MLDQETIDYIRDYYGRFKPEITAVESGKGLGYSGDRASKALMIPGLSDEDKTYLRTMKGIINILK